LPGNKQKELPAASGKGGWRDYKRTAGKSPEPADRNVYATKGRLLLFGLGFVGIVCFHAQPEEQGRAEANQNPDGHRKNTDERIKMHGGNIAFLQPWRNFKEQM
jgi:hypothetical protein